MCEITHIGHPHTRLISYILIIHLIEIYWCLLDPLNMFATRDPLYNKFKALKGGVFTIEGIIGVGKTTLGRSLEAFLNSIGLKARFYPEYVNKELLSQYIGDMKRYAYSFQMVMLCKRIEIYREAERFANEGGVALIDRSIIGDMTFARMQKDNGNFTDDEWRIYLSLMKQEIQLTPTASVYLYCTADTSLARVKQRGIEAEIKGYTREYMEQLHKAYEVSISECTNVKHIWIGWDTSMKLENGLLTNNLTQEILAMLL